MDAIYYIRNVCVLEVAAQNCRLINMHVSVLRGSTIYNHVSLQRYIITIILSLSKRYKEGIMRHTRYQLYNISI